jgi:hypothetical protein
MSDRFDLKGATPESWACIDCGINTAPGYPTRAEIERLYKTSLAIERLSGKALPLELTFDDRCEVYMVRDSVSTWAIESCMTWIESLVRRLP